MPPSIGERAILYLLAVDAKNNPPSFRRRASLGRAACLVESQKREAINKMIITAAHCIKRELF